MMLPPSASTSSDELAPPVATRVVQIRPPCSAPSRRSLTGLSEEAIRIPQGILVYVPSPARFALHKLVVSRRRPAAFAEKARRELAQAAAVFELLVEDRPAEISFAADAAKKMPLKVILQTEEGLAKRPDDLANAIRDCM